MGKTMDDLRILIADDHEVARQGVRAVLHQQPGCHVAWEAVNGREAVQIARQERPDLSILDLGMPEMNGLEAAQHILHDQPQAEVLILTMHESEQLVRDVLDSGARGYVLKSDAGRDLVAAVDALRQHRVFFTSKIASIVVGDYQKARRELHKGGASLSHGLSGREREIVRLLAEGKSNKEVAATLVISVKTVETHRHRIMQKLDLGSVVELVHYALRNHLVYREEFLLPHLPT
jgi:DNA-binding NarL/FixJ family response regulator